jgi:hypothetical protein
MDTKKRAFHEGEEQFMIWHEGILIERVFKTLVEPLYC